MLNFVILNIETTNARGILKQNYNIGVNCRFQYIFGTMVILQV